jgi:hypothetical protein
MPRLSATPTPEEVIAELRYWQKMNGAPIWTHTLELIGRLSAATPPRA